MNIVRLSALPWQFRDATQASRWRSATVPGCVHRDLLRHGLIPDPFHGTNELGLQWIEQHDWEYRTTFRLPAALRNSGEIDLVFDGLDTLATVFLNGRRIASSDNMFVPQRLAVRRWLRPGANELRVFFASAGKAVKHTRSEHQPREFNDSVGRCSVLRKQQCQFGWDWGPRFVTAGVWRDVRLEAWDGNRLDNVRLTQTHHADGRVAIAVAPEFARPAAGVTCYVTLALGDEIVAIASGSGRQLRLDVPQPRLWWPNGHGAQPLYTVRVRACDADGRELGEVTKRIGLRTIVLDRSKDRWGESFQFVVNGRPVFAKGANWIPAHSFVAGLGRGDYARDLQSAVQANMNMLRIWGGGIYEDEAFFDLCDELGLLVWHDFMFACTLYPGDAAFLASVRAEAEAQVARIRHRACLALWCGNNEIETLNWEALEKTPRLRRNYDAVFHRVLPAVVSRLDGVTPYWPTSPYRGEGRSNDYTVKALGEKSGDTHFWDVWHARHPVKDYEKWRFRFVSEFGMQSYSSPATQATFCPADDGNVFGAVMENHQKNAAGNQIILDYVSRVYRFPKNQEALIYLSQLNQALCMQTGVEHYRRISPCCMGALYWQLNDCWPVASWSSIEHTGRWKALHHVARRFFAPALVSAHVPGVESTTIGNYRRSSVREVHLYTVYDGPAPARGRLLWDVFHLDGRVLLSGRKDVALRYGRGVKQRTLDLADLLAAHGRDRLYVRIALEVDGERVSEETVFLTPPRFLSLPTGKTEVGVRVLDSYTALLTFRSAVFQHRFAFDLAGLDHRSSDNFFELYPGEKKEVLVTLAHPATKAELTRRLRHQSLVDSYA
ncbi:MAG TPA: glycoside hydrolase family 2 protein [Opitutaceae bacterium]|nr:glycoside hydrolase family 2 protein [Opitutaceae bacterium]HND60667.1 glycoside hydrolase family 2 protein [Opitutaceae bacterium]